MTIRRLCSAILDAVLPPQCLGCGGVVQTPGALCPRCWSAARFIAPPFCTVCGLPMGAEAAGLETCCAACLARRPRFHRARAVMLYDGPAKDLVLRLKHADRTDMAPALAAWMARAGAALLAEADLLAPVPLHWGRLFRRRYNQAALLAVHLARLSNRPCVPDLLERSRATPSQGHLGRTQRAGNVRNAFSLRSGVRVEGCRVLLVDDVFTTGATLSECARILQAGGAAQVDALTLARVE